MSVAVLAVLLLCIEQVSNEKMYFKSSRIAEPNHIIFLFQLKITKQKTKELRSIIMRVSNLELGGGTDAEAY